MIKTVCLAVFVGLTAMTGVQAQTTTTIETAVASNDDYTIEWITPKRPPMPPVKKNGKWVTWEEVHGPLPPLEPRPVKRYKTPRPPVDPELQWIGAKRKVAPQLFADGKPTLEAEKIIYNKAARAATLEKSKGQINRPKIDGLDARLFSPLISAQTALRGGPVAAGGPTPNGAGDPRLEIVAIRILPASGRDGDRTLVD